MKLEPTTFPALEPIKDSSESLSRESASLTLAEKLYKLGFHDNGGPLSGNQKIEDLRRPEETFDVFSADSAQAKVIAEALEGDDLLVTGPPGTGKSVTIANLLVNAVAHGKRVLLVAPGEAALESARKWLCRAGLGELALELYGEKAAPRAILEELETTLRLGRPVELPRAETIRRLTRAEDRMNEHARTMAAGFRDSGLSAYQIISEFLSTAAPGRPDEQKSRAVHERGKLDFDSPEMRSWDGKTLAQALKVLTNLEHSLSTKGSPATHLFQGVGLSIAELNARPGLNAEIRATRDSARAAREALNDLCSKLGLSSDMPTPLLIKTLEVLDHIAEYYSGDGAYFKETDFSGRGLEHEAKTLRETIAAGKALAPLRDALLKRVKPAAFAAPNLEKLKELLEMQAQKSPRCARFAAELKLANELFASLCLDGKVPEDAGEKVTLVAELLTAEELSSRLLQAAPLFREIFGANWVPEHAASRDFWRKLEFVVESALQLSSALRQHPQKRALESLIKEPVALYRLDENGVLGRSLNGVKTYLAKREKLAAALKFDKEAFRSRFDEESLNRQEQLLNDWERGFDCLPELCRYQEQYSVQNIPGLKDIIKRAEQWTLAGNALVDAVKGSWLAGLVEDFLTFSPLAKQFDTLLQAQYLKEYREAEAQYRKVNSCAVALRHWDRMPRLETGGEHRRLSEYLALKEDPPVSAAGIFAACPRIISAIKPIVIAAPEALPALKGLGAGHFDLLICDEASDLRPADLSAAAPLARQLLAFGDPAQHTQLPTGDNLIGHLRAMGTAQRDLPIHYRSLDGRLMEVFNRELYGDALRTFPNALRKAAARLTALCTGNKHAGEPAGVSMNEAQRVCELVAAHVRAGPQKSLEVITLSGEQKELIQAELRQESARDRLLAAFMERKGLEPFVVRTMEEAQGDERDRVILSLAFDGSSEKRFGKISESGGENVLNVIASRAREQVSIVASVRAEEIKAGSAASRGELMLKRYLAAAESASGVPPADENTGLNDKFQAAIQAALEERGYKVVPHVGEGELGVDLAVIDPLDEGRFILGILTDGERAQRIESARERDIIIPEELKRRGWNIKQISILEWLKDQTQCLAAILKEIESAEGPGACYQSPTLQTAPIFRESTVNRTERARALLPFYEKAPLRCGSKGVLPAREQILKDALKVVQLEAPLHQDELLRRLSLAYEIDPGRRNVSEALASALFDLEREGRILRRQQFVLTPANGTVLPRDRSRVELPLRQWTKVAPEEIEAAVFTVVKNACRIEAAEIPGECFKLLGLAGSESGFEHVVDKARIALLEGGALRQSATMLECNGTGLPAD